MATANYNVMAALRQMATDQSKGSVLLLANMFKNSSVITDADITEIEGIYTARQQTEKARILARIGKYSKSQIYYDVLLAINDNLLQGDSADVTEIYTAIESAYT